MRNELVEKMVDYLDGVDMYTSYEVMNRYYQDNLRNKKELNERLGLVDGRREFSIEYQESGLKVKYYKAFEELRGKVLEIDNLPVARLGVYFHADFIDDEGRLAELSTTQETALEKSGIKTRAQKGMKFTKFWSKVAKELGIEENIIEDFLTKASKIQRVLKKEKVIISTNPFDILTMSDGNSWSSCHRMEYNNKHEYKCGTLSYIIDNESFIIFSQHRDSENVKNWRYLGHMQNEKIGVCGAYPNDNDARDDEIIRVLENITGLSKSMKGSKTQYLGYDDGFSFCLQDEECVNDYFEIELYNEEYYALDTGISTDVQNHLCSSEVEWCYFCEEYRPSDDMVKVTGSYGVDLVCESCVEWSDSIHYCTVCEKYHYDIVFNAEYDMCDKCLSNNYEECEHCGCYVHVDDMYENENYDCLCYDCNEELEREEE